MHIENKNMSLFASSLLARLFLSLIMQLWSVKTGPLNYCQRDATRFKLDLCIYINECLLAALYVLVHEFIIPPDKGRLVLLQPQGV